MSTVRCPEGHPSTSTDYCDVCGAPIAAAGASTPAAAGTSPSAGPTTCPHCQSPAAAGALFCENCGYDFTTGATPAPLVPPAGVASTSSPSAATGEQPAVEATEVRAQEPATDPATGASPGPGPASAGGGLPTPAPDGPDSWVAEVWIDPDWYALQSPEDPMPSAGLPVLVPLRTRSALVGRPSVSRNIHPTIDCGADSGVSRRHCQLNTDGTRWWVEDLQSSNGTYVARVGEPLPQAPIPVGQRYELADGDRVYVGAWTRIVVRLALPGEV